MNAAIQITSQFYTFVVTPNINSMKSTVVLFFSIVLFSSCGGSTTQQSTESQTANKPYDPILGEGKFTSISIPDSVDENLASLGEIVFQSKCTACHKMTDEKLVGPGLKGVSKRKKAAWIMNYMTNSDVMIEKDPELQEQLKIYAVRMPNQGLTDDDARRIYEYLRKNDL